MMVGPKYKIVKSYEEGTEFKRSALNVKIEIPIWQNFKHYHPHLKWIQSETHIEEASGIKWR